MIQSKIRFFQRAMILFVLFSCSPVEVCNSGDPASSCGLLSSLSASAVSQQLNAVNSLKIFVTAATFSGTMDRLTPPAGTPTGSTPAEKADNWCMSDAIKPDQKVYKAMLVDETGCSGPSPCRRACTTSNCATADGNGLVGTQQQIDWVLYPNTMYTQVDGITPILTTNENAIFIFGNAMNSVNGTSEVYWTGLDNTSTWTTAVGQNCSNWFANNTLTGNAGIGNAMGATMLNNGPLSCNGTMSTRLLCVEQ